ncbi:hypothetical protein BGZ80_008153, partial [Entomortierella chlamydospora]
ENSSELFWSELQSKVDTIISSRKAGIITRAAGLEQAANDYKNHLSSENQVIRSQATTT